MKNQPIVTDLPPDDWFRNECLLFSVEPGLRNSLFLKQEFIYISLYLFNTAFVITT